MLYIDKEIKMDFTKIDAFLEKMPERGIPSIDVAFTKDGEPVYRKCVGFSDPEKTKPVCPTDIYWIFSATKVITCVAAMQLVEKGVIALDDPVSKYIPSFEKLTVKDKEKGYALAETVMTVEHLFTMTGGLTYDLNTPNLKKAKAEHLGTVELVSRIPNDPLMFEPGTRYRYSLCHDVLGAVVEVASGMRFSDYLQKNIFDPLEMKDIGFRPYDDQRERFSALYRHYGGIQSCVNVPISNSFILTDNYDSAGAGLFSTVDDYMKLIAALSLGGTAKNGYRVLTEESIKMMGENRLCPDALNDFVNTRSFGYGWGLCGRAHISPDMSLRRTAKGEFGWDGAAGAFVMVDPTNRTSLYIGTHILGSQYMYHVVHPTVTNMLYEAFDL